MKKKDERIGTSSQEESETVTRLPHYKLKSRRRGFRNEDSEFDFVSFWVVLSLKTVVMPVSKTRRDDKDNWYWYLRLGKNR